MPHQAKQPMRVNGERSGWVVKEVTVLRQSSSLAPEPVPAHTAHPGSNPARLNGSRNHTRGVQRLSKRPRATLETQ